MVEATWSVEKSEVKAREVDCSAGLSPIQFPRRREVNEVLVIRVHINLMGRPFQIVMPVLKGAYDGQ